MNFVPPGEIRDTTSPLAMAQLVARFFDGSLLSPQSGKTLRTWMEDTHTGMRRIRAGFPEDWPAGDKTGTAIAEGMPSKYNDIAVVWPDSAHAFVVTAYYEADGTYDEIRVHDEKVLEHVGKIARATVDSSGDQS